MRVWVEDIMRNTEQLANTLARVGEKMNEEIRKEYKENAEKVKASTIEEKMWLAIITGLSWAIQGCNNLYIQHIFRKTYKPTIVDLTEKEIKEAVYVKCFKGRNKIRIEKGLMFYKEEIFSEMNPNDAVENPKKLNDLILNSYEKYSGMGHWTAFVPLKVMFIAGLFPNDPDVINSLNTPLGRCVRDGIEYITGVKINELKKYDIKFAQLLHRNFAKLANTYIYTINSGFWKLGEKVIKNSKRAY